jgi:hypothetical protein
MRPMIRFIFLFYCLFCLFNPLYANGLEDLLSQGLQTPLPASILAEDLLPIIIEEEQEHITSSENEQESKDQPVMYSATGKHSIAFRNCGRNQFNDFLRLSLSQQRGIFSSTDFHINTEIVWKRSNRLLLAPAHLKYLLLKSQYLAAPSDKPPKKQA